MSKYRIIVDDGLALGVLRNTPYRFKATIEKRVPFRWIRAGASEFASTLDGARQKAEAQLDGIKNPQKPNFKVYYYD